ncbi:MAG: CHAD domain-containing protein, partial [Hyphomicrobium sp.]
MAFRFKLGEPFDEGVRRIAVEQIGRAQAQLSDKGDQAIAVHETRKALKRLRALLRLIRPAMGGAAFKRENAQLREIGLSLSGARDRHVLLETVNKLEGGAGLGRKGLIANVRACIAAANGDGPPPSMQQAQERLADTQKRLAELPIEGSGFDVVAAGLER